jgi:hypothetical protein
MFFQYLMIPETHDSVSNGFEPGGSSGILFGLFSVLPPIGFDNQSGLQTYKIDNVGFNHHLTPKFITSQSTVSQMFP